MCSIINENFESQGALSHDSEVGCYSEERLTTALEFALKILSRRS